MSLDQIFALFDARGAESYGEAITQLEHALQSGQCAEAEAAGDALVTAAVLHDVGHLLHRDTQASYDRGADDRHEALAAKHLARFFGPEVVEPVRLHVAAKRYLCFADPAYHAGLSPTSQMSLRLQGGPMDAEEAAAFRTDPHFDAAIRLRRWDEAAKVPGAVTPDLAHYRRVAERCARTEAGEEA
jgi:phosphonate degradation associated HDIG domain protein